MGLNRKDELLLLVAVSGELPADWIGIAVGSESYGAALITRLKKEEKRWAVGLSAVCKGQTISAGAISRGRRKVPDGFFQH